MDDSPLTREATTERPRRANATLILLGILSPSLGFDAIGRAKQGWLVFLAFYLFFLLMPFTPLMLLALPVWWLFAVLAPLFLASWSHPARVWPTFFLRLLLGIALSIGVRLSYLEAFKIPAGSMLPTLEVGNHLYASKFELWSRGPERGELVIFIYPVRPEQDFVKRVVGLPGDTIAVNDELLVNGSAVRSDGESQPCRYQDRDELADDHWEYVEAECRRETLDGRTYTVVVDALAPSTDFPREGDPSPYVVPPGHYFVMGDNRAHSSDSRFWGPVPAANIKALPRYVWYSKGPDGIRWSRLGHWLR